MLHPLVAKLLLLPALWYPPGQPRPETPEQYEQRLGTIAQAAIVAAQQVQWEWGDRMMVAAVLAHWYGETKFDEAVHRGLPGKYGSDNGHSACFGQFHDSWVPRDEWLALKGTSLEATTRCAVKTAKLIRAMRYCTGPGHVAYGLSQIFAAMGTGRCSPITAAARSKTRVVGILVGAWPR